MKSVVLVPYCPLPADTGGKVEMWKYLNMLKELGSCTILSAGMKPVGCGWTPETRREIEARGFKVVLREDECTRLSWRQLIGMAYAAVCKGLRLEKAFGHSNPYHRFAFDPAWFYRHTQQVDIAVINYSYWAWLPCECPKVVMLLDLWSNYMWEGPKRETFDLQSAQLVVTISKNEERDLRARGVSTVLWSPPFVESVAYPDTHQVGLVGSSNEFNQNGLRWLGRPPSGASVRVYGGLSAYISADGYVGMGAYRDTMEPYRTCGIILIPTRDGMGVQIKTIEALAAGRAIVARRGAMRGIPDGNGAWIEVDTSEELWDAVKSLQNDATARKNQMTRSREYYRQHLDAVRLRSELELALSREVKTL